MRLTRTIKLQLAVFAVIAVASVTVMFFGYMQIPTAFFDLHRYTVTLQLPAAGGLYPGGNVTYNGVEVGRVDAVRLRANGAEAVLKLDTAFKIPADLKASVHSVSAIGEQYVQLSPQSGAGPSLKNGDVIPQDRTEVQPDINGLLEAANRGLKAIPGDNLQTVVDESYTAFAGLGPDLSRLVTGSTNLARDARRTLDSQIALIEGAQPILGSQTRTSDSIRAWATNLASISSQLHDKDAAVRGILDKGPGAAAEVRGLFDRLQPTLPIFLSNLVSVDQVAVTYRPDLEAVLVLLPRGVEIFQGPLTPNRFTKRPGAFLAFNLNLNIPKPCTTGFLPSSQIRTPVSQDFPDRPNGDLYCRIPQDAPTDVRGARNYPCETKPGKRAPTAAMCESDEEYVPLNDGWNWKGDPNATTTGQDIPQPRPAAKPSGAAPPSPAAPPLPPIAAAQYDPATGDYVGPDGKIYTQRDLARGAVKEKTWQDMLMPPNEQ
ncbi:MCE family protein [Mycobacterium sp. E796]|uniref:MCE family protein n=1 Tax=Mycobacterium sp. E796 TaxID=1834151 RepID=UPI0008000097|nr:MlaD family protein [Mycobacterium sp. E796]OBI70530.1 mammalian cell entry protein [Mycobacterium sp. E796]